MSVGVIAEHIPTQRQSAESLTEADHPIDNLDQRSAVAAKAVSLLETPVISETGTIRPYGVGQIAVMNSWRTSTVAGQRTHELQRVGLVGRQHVRLHTDPVKTLEEQDLTIASLLGWTESAHSPLTRRTHIELAHELPNAAIDTHATYGTDGTLADHSLASILRQGVEEAAQKTFETFLELYGDQRLALVATSMGAAITARLLSLNEEAERPLSVAGVILYEPYLVTRKHAGLKMIPRFAKHLVCNSVNEMRKHASTQDIWDLANDVVHYRPRISDGAVIARQGLSLLKGTSSDKLTILAEQGPYCIQGDHDCVREPEFEAHPAVISKLVPDKGHSMGYHPAKRARSVAKGVRTLDLHS